MLPHLFAVVNPRVGFAIAQGLRKIIYSIIAADRREVLGGFAGLAATRCHLEERVRSGGRPGESGGVASAWCEGR